MSRCSVGLLLLLGFAACGDRAAGGGTERTASRADAVIYGNDDRMDVYAHPDARMRAIANLSSVVLVWPPYIDEGDPANIRPSNEVPTLGDYKKLCATEPFRSDPAMGSCSGALIDDDLVLTAGHCVPTAEDCATARFVFGWQRTSPTALHTMTKDDVFRCQERLVFRYETVGETKQDYAIVKLDRSAAPRFRPTAVRRAASALSSGLAVGIIGYGSGIPAKIDVGGRVLDPGASDDAFVHTSDAYSGNSGSPVFDLGTYEIAGILVRGTAEDFVDTGTCFVNQACPAEGGAANGCTGMSSDYAPKSIAVLCANPVWSKAYPRLCAMSSCGNGRCEASETLASCPADCTVPDASAPEPDESLSQVAPPSAPASPSERASASSTPRAADSAGCRAASGARASSSAPISGAAIFLLLLLARGAIRRGGGDGAARRSR